MPGLGIGAEGEGDILPAFRCRRFAGGTFGAGDGEAFLVHEGDLVRRDARHAEVPVVRAVELPVVNLRRDGLRAAELEAELDHAVLRPDVVADDGLMPFHRGLALLRRGIEAPLRAVLQGIRWHHNGPSLCPCPARRARSHRRRAGPSPPAPREMRELSGRRRFLGRGEAGREGPLSPLGPRFRVGAEIPACSTAKALPSSSAMDLC